LEHQQASTGIATPHDAVALGINKFGANGDIVVSLQHAAGENGVDAKFTGNRRWINGLAFVTVRGSQRNDLQVGKLRERADETWVIPFRKDKGISGALPRGCKGVALRGFFVQWIASVVPQDRMRRQGRSMLRPYKDNCNDTRSARCCGDGGVY